jgi:hypothetical protein
MGITGTRPGVFAEVIVERIVLEYHPWEQTSLFVVAPREFRSSWKEDRNG